MRKEEGGRLGGIMAVDCIVICVSRTWFSALICRAGRDGRII